jgi:hypothetical protein
LKTREINPSTIGTVSLKENIMLVRFTSILVASFVIGGGVFASTAVPTIGRIVVGNSATEKYCSVISEEGLCLMTLQKAEEYCNSQGSRLPTAREYSQFSLSLGAEGLLEEQEYKEQKAAGKDVSNYIKVSTKEDNGKIDTFYLDHGGYQTPNGNLGFEWVWSSSISSTGNTKPYQFLSIYGFLHSEENFPIVKGAVRCIR